MVYGLWFMVYGLWFMVYGLWFMVYGLWFMVYGLWLGVMNCIQLVQPHQARGLFPEPRLEVIHPVVLGLRVVEEHQAPGA
jgi:hypothetical protein